MKVSFENPSKTSGKITVVVEQADYANDVEKTLKTYRNRANMPGFRPGQVPMSLVRRQYGEAAKMDAINKIVGDALQKHITDNKLQVLGSPMAAKEQTPQDLATDGPFTFAFEVALAPEFKVELTDKDKIEYCTIKVDDKIIDNHIDALASRLGNYEKAETYSENDMLKGDMRELDEKGNAKEGGLEIEGAVLMPTYIKVEDQKKLFDGAKLGDIITMNPRKAYPENDSEMASFLKIKKEEVAEHTGDFSFQITEISHFEKAAVDQKLFDQVLGKDAVKDEKAFREKIAENMKQQFAVSSDYMFLRDVRAYAEKKVGKLEFADDLMKRIMLEGNKDKGEKFVEEHYDESIKHLTWTLIREQLVEANKIKLTQDDIREAAKAQARMQFAQYGMDNVPDEYLENYANETLKKRETMEQVADQAIDLKLVEALKKVVKLTNKEMSLDDFNKRAEEK